MKQGIMAKTVHSSTRGMYRCIQYQGPWSLVGQSLILLLGTGKLLPATASLHSVHLESAG